MQYNELGKSGLKVSSIAFGAWAIGGWMWGGADDKKAIEAIHACMDHGVSTLDTAPIYGFGHSEELVGKAIEGKRQQVQLLTKFGLVWNGNAGQHYFESQDAQGKTVAVNKYAGKESIMAECEASLRRLKTDYIDLLQIHWPDETTPIAETMEALELLLQQGKIRAAGVCNYNAAQTQEALNSLTIASNQVPFSMVERKIEPETLPYCLANQVSIIAYSPLQRGLLTGKITPGYAFKEGDHRPKTRYFKPENIVAVNQMLDQLRPMAQDRDLTLGQLVLAWTLRQPGIDCVLAGARNAVQATENAYAGQVSLSLTELETINKAYQTLSLV